MQAASQQAVESIAETGDDKKNKRPEIVPIDQMDDDERNKDHPQEGQLIGSSEDVRELHAGSLEGIGIESARGARATEGSRPVLEKKRCDSEGKVPSARSSSTRSMRCIGKKTTAGVNGSPSRTITARSSNDASSAPLRLSPSGASTRIIPQNFSLGLHKVAMTSAPGANGALLEGVTGIFSMARLSAGMHLHCKSKRARKTRTTCWARSSNSSMLCASIGTRPCD